jgi:hypothetical protein
MNNTGLVADFSPRSFSEAGTFLLVLDETFEVEIGHAHYGVSFRAQASILLAHFHLQRAGNLSTKRGGNSRKLNLLKF